MSSSRPRAIASGSIAPPAVRAVPPVRKPRKVNKSAPAVVTSRKGKEKAPNQGEDTAEPIDEQTRPQKKRKRTPSPRITSPALPSTSSPSPPPAAFVRPAPAEKDLDFLDVVSIPNNGRTARSRKLLDRLEMGNHRSALHNVAKLQLDLSKNLVEWESVRLRQSRIEEDEVREERESQERLIIEKHERRGRRRLQKEARIMQGDVGEMEMSESEEEGWEKSKGGNHSDDAAPPLSTYDLARISRWPLVPSVLPKDDFTLGEELLALLETKSKDIKSREGVPPIPEKKNSARAPSAYAAGGPFASTEDLSSNSDSEDDSINSDHSFSLTPELSRIIANLSSTLDTLLQSMAQETTPCYFPPTDYWEAKMVKDAWRTKPPKRGLDFNDVMRLVEDMSTIPQAVKDALSGQLRDLYGEDRSFFSPLADVLLLTCLTPSAS